MQLVGESTVAALSWDAVAEPVREFRSDGWVEWSTRPEPGVSAWSWDRSGGLRPDDQESLERR
jgi:hypothetical protein